MPAIAGRLTPRRRGLGRLNGGGCGIGTLASFVGLGLEVAWAGFLWPWGCGFREVGPNGCGLSTLDGLPLLESCTYVKNAMLN
jgi:hypothetical protein